MLTVVTPTLNAERFIGTCIASIAALPFEHEHIVVDGGSTDETTAVAEAAGVTVLSQGPAPGMYGAVEQGLRAGRGEILTYVNADDEAVPAMYARLYRRMLEDDAPTLVYGDGTYRWVGGDAPPRDEFVASRAAGGYFLRQGLMPFTQPSCLFRRDAFEAVGGFDAENYRIAGDLEFFRRLATRPGFRAVRLRGSASVFLKYGASLGDLNAKRSEDERERMGVHRTASLPQRVLFRLASWV